MKPLNSHRAWAVIGLSALLITASLNVFAQTAPASSATTTSADNTKINQRDQSNQTTTPTHQPNDKSDIKLAAAVRRAIVKDKSLSMLAHNVKIVAIQGAVTLRGPVKSDDEKARVQTIVQSVAGVNSVNNDLDVKP